MLIETLTAGHDNYLYLVHNHEDAAVIDACCADTVLQALAERDLKLGWIFITHHHHDHIAGLRTLKEQTGAEVIAADDPRIPGIDRRVTDQEIVTTPVGDFTVLATPGHGDRDVSYLWTGSARPAGGRAGSLALPDDAQVASGMGRANRPGEPNRAANSPESPALFCGDTLFVSGCGRILDGRAAALWASLQKLAQLDDSTRVYCGHEYTEDNLHFALTQFPDDQAYADRLEEIKQQLQRDGTSVPSTIAIEKRCNPFLRCRDLAEFTKLRSLKDRF